MFTEKDGYYYGRGTADDKAMASIFVANVYRMKQEGYVPDRDIIIALTADEESGPFNGVDWLLKHHRDLVDAAVVINEGGGGTLRNGRTLFNGVQAAEKITTNFTLRVTNAGGHSSVPRRDNAITSLADALAKVGRHQFTVKLNEVTRAFFTETAKLETPAMGKAMAALVANPADAAARVSLHFREKAFWTFSRGQRLGDMRRLIRQYGRTEQTVFPQGVHYKGGNYGTDVNLPVVQAERNNPNFTGCTDRNP